jgi:hypothetical protein
MHLMLASGLALRGLLTSLYIVLVDRVLVFVHGWYQSDADDLSTPVGTQYRHATPPAALLDDAATVCSERCLLHIILDEGIDQCASSIVGPR